MRRSIFFLTVSLCAVLLSGCSDESATQAPTQAVIEAQAAADLQGFVFSRWSHHIPREDPGECPDGLNVTEEEFLSEEYNKVRDEVKRRYDSGDREGALSLLPPDACKDPLIKPDPGHLTLDGPATVAGLDLDGKVSRKADGGQCPHDDFTGPNGETGIDNQHWRLYGCVAGYRPDGLFDRLFDTDNSILENGHATLLELKVVSGDLKNGRVEAQLFTSSGPVSTDSSGKVIRDMSQVVHDDPLYHSAVFRGEIVDGVLNAGPVDARLRFKVQALDNHYDFRDVRIQAKVREDGSLQGVLAAFWDSDNLYDFLTSVYIGPVHLGRAAANNIGYMCAGVYHAIPRVADGHPDPDTGKCTSVSTLIDFEAVPAFVIKPDVAPEQTAAR